MAKQEVMPSAELEPREGDVELTPEQLGRLSLFAPIKNKTFLEKFPGTLRVRLFRAREAICRQGEPGWTAFYILTAADVESVLGAGPAGPRPAGPVYRRTVEDLLLLPADAEPEICATIYLAIPRPAEAAESGWLGRVRRRLFGGRAPAPARPRPRYIPIDAPTDVDRETLQAHLREGDLFGEMSCLNRSPRSATIIAARDCYVLEMLRNVFEKVKEDANYKKRVEEEYKRRSLDQQLRNIPLFAGLSDAQVGLVRQRATLKTYKSGQIICDEHDRSDDVFLVRSGLVKVLKGDSALLAVRDVLDWPALVAALRAPAGPAAKVASAIPAPVQEMLAGDPAELSDAAKQEIVHALNLSIKGPALWTDAALKDLAAAADFQAEVKQLPALQKEWPERDVRRLNRRLVERAVPGLRPLRRVAGAPEAILAYRARGELIGEMGLLRGQPRSATCVAFIHARDELARKEAAKRDLEAVELVHLPAALFEELLKDPAFRAQVDAVLAERVASDKRVLSKPAAAEGVPVQRSGRFEELGLVQGQRLMLIDLDRCTRCDECVTACVNSHDDGRSRLFLDGPRIGQYLVPTTCRSCLDPVCMIGCPVGSIHRGDNGQIVIEDWCIGCGLCAGQCPYGSIQMHDTGVIPESAHGWKYRSADGAAGDGWAAAGYRDGGWRAGQAPFALDRDFLAGAAPASAYQFRYAFELARGRLAPGDELRASIITAPGAEVKAWLNGRPMELHGPEKEKKAYPEPDWAKLASGLTFKDVRREVAVFGFAVPQQDRAVRTGRNVVAVWVQPPKDYPHPFFDLRLDAVRAQEMADQVEKGVTEAAVVCDLCSSLPGKVPACVRACPHDAAMRVDARRNFPA